MTPNPQAQRDREAFSAFAMSKTETTEISIMDAWYAALKYARETAHAHPAPQGGGEPLGSNQIAAGAEVEYNGSQWEVEEVWSEDGRARCKILNDDDDLSVWADDLKRWPSSTSRLGMGPDTKEGEA